MRSVGSMPGLWSTNPFLDCSVFQKTLLVAHTSFSDDSCTFSPDPVWGDRNMRNKFVWLTMILGLVAFPVQSAFALSIGGGLATVKKHLDPKFVSSRGPALAPMGHVIFCTKAPHQCRSFGHSVVQLDDTKKRQLASINRQVNRQIRETRDKGTHGWADTWTLAPESGDCEDFALTKRAELIARGWPSRALRMAVGKTNWGEGHAVLVVRTNEGDMVLDNLTGSVVPWQKSGLIWLKIQSHINAKQWFAI
jgi:predicted transglutaminase-like cysteine proteinase